MPPPLQASMPWQKLARCRIIWKAGMDRLRLASLGSSVEISTGLSGCGTGKLARSNALAMVNMAELGANGERHRNQNRRGEPRTFRSVRAACRKSWAISVSIRI
jgi:hypothetical protein